MVTGNSTCVATPNGTTTTQDGKSICLPEDWFKTLMWFIAGFIALATTVKSYPGEATASQIVPVVRSIQFPGSGFVPGLNGMHRFAAIGSTVINKAKRGGVLVHLVRKPDWVPQAGDRASDAIRQSLENCKGLCEHKMVVYTPPWLSDASGRWSFTDTAGCYVDSSRRVHGFYDIPNGYVLAHVPHDAVIDTTLGEGIFDPEHTIESQYNIFKIISSGGQLGLGLWTFFRSRGDQLTDYGFFAPDLAAIPYAFMALFNFLGNLMTPDYQSLYLVGSEIMDEAKRRGGKFEVTVGRLTHVNIPIEGLTCRQVRGVFRDRTASDGSPLMPSQPVYLPPVRDEDSIALLEEAFKNYHINSMKFCLERLDNEQRDSDAEHNIEIYRLPRPGQHSCHPRCDSPCRERETKRQVDFTDTILIPSCPLFRRLNQNRPPKIDYSKFYAISSEVSHFAEIRSTPEPGTRARHLTNIQVLILSSLPILMMGCVSKFSFGRSPLPKSDMVFMIIHLLITVPLGALLSLDWHATPQISKRNGLLDMLTDILTFRNTTPVFVSICCFFILGVRIQILIDMLSQQSICIKIS